MGLSVLVNKLWSIATVGPAIYEWTIRNDSRRYKHRSIAEINRAKHVHLLAIHIAYLYGTLQKQPPRAHWPPPMSAARARDDARAVAPATTGPGARKLKSTYHTVDSVLCSFAKLGSF